MNLKKILFSVGLALSACLLLGQSTITVPPGKGWSAALRNAGLSPSAENVAIFQAAYGDPQPTSYVFPGEVYSTPAARVSTSSARQAPSSILLPQTSHVVKSGDTFHRIAKQYYRHTLDFVSGEHRDGIVAQYAATIAFMNKYHDGERYTKSLVAGDTLWLPPANPLKLYDQEDYIVGYAHYMLLGDTYYGITTRWYSSVQGFRILNYDHVQTTDQIHDQAVGSLWYFGATTPRIRWVDQEGVRQDGF